MRKATSIKVQPGAATSVPQFIPAPVGGMNTRDPLSALPVTDARLMSNYFAGTAGVVKRKGTIGHITGTLNACETLMVYTTSAGTETMFAAITTAFYDVTAAGALGAAVVSGLANSRWQYVNFTNSNGTSYLCAFNGADSPRYWDGATWTAITGVSTPAITGVTTTTLIAATVHQRRMWLIQAASLKAWYLPVDSVGGAANALDLGGIANLGGFIMAINTWTVDGGAGIDDYLVVITSAGQVIAYRGIDPSSASTWELVGVWSIGQPVGRRCFCQYKGDLLILTTGGIASLVKIMAGDASASGMITDKIAPTYISLLGSGDAVPDLWQLLYYPKADMLIWSAGMERSYAMNTITGAWSQWSFTARTWALFNEEPYFARYQNNNVIVRFWVGNQDESNGSTTAISGQITQGYTNLGMPVTIKKTMQIRFLFIGDATWTLDYGLQPDYRALTQSQGPFTSQAVVDGLTNWYPATAIGTAFALYFSSTSSGNDTYNGAYVICEPGGLVGSSGAL